MALARLPGLLQGEQLVAEWNTDPWRLHVRSEPAQDLAYLTLHMPGHYIAIHEAAVPLGQLARELITLGHRLGEHIQSYAEQPAVMAGDTSIVGPPAMAYTSYGIRQQEPVGHGKKTTRFEQLHYAFEVRGLGGEPGVLMNNAIRTD